MAFWRKLLFCLKKEDIENDEDIEYCCELKCWILGLKARGVVDGIACEKCLSFCECYCNCKVWMKEY